jgi:hypothetical protein
MTQEEKSLLFKDLCARLPYSPKCEMIDELRVVNNEREPSYISVLFPKHLELFSYHNNFTIKPYLRSMSSMTEEEKKEYKHFIAFSGSPDGAAIFVDWLNKRMFAYRTINGKDMFELGLALEAPNDMYNLNKK